MQTRDQDKKYWSRWYGWVIGLLVAENEIQNLLLASGQFSHTV